jgi:hypothetical protein
MTPRPPFVPRSKLESRSVEMHSAAPAPPGIAIDGLAAPRASYGPGVDRDNPDSGLREVSDLALVFRFH